MIAAEVAAVTSLPSLTATPLVPAVLHVVTSFADQHSPKKLGETISRPFASAGHLDAGAEGVAVSRITSSEAVVEPFLALSG